MRCVSLLALPLASALLLAVGAAPAGEKAGPDNQGTLVVIDANGKELKVKNWKLTKGTKHLSWLAPADEGKDKGKKQPPAGPEALEFVEGKLPPLKKGVLTYVPLTSVRGIDFDGAKETMTVRVAKSDKEADDDILVGPTGYVGINQVAITAVTDLGELGQAAVEFHGGVDRGIRGLRFPSPKPIEALPEGRAAVIKQTSKKYPT